jgi:hypothetical protein
MPTCAYAHFEVLGERPTARVASEASVKNLPKTTQHLDGLGPNASRADRGIRLATLTIPAPNEPTEEVQMRLIALSSALCAALAVAACDNVGTDRRADATRTAPEPPAAQAPADQPTAQPAAADAAIRDRVMAALAAANDVDESAITVESTNGRVVLSGRLPNQSQVDRAVTAAKTVDGVREVESRLTVG